MPQVKPFLEKMQEAKITALRKKLETMTMVDVGKIGIKYDCGEYSTTKEKLINKVLKKLIETRNIDDDTLFDLTKEPFYPISKSEVKPTFSSSEAEVICRIRLDEDFDMRMVFPKGKTRADLEKTLAHFFNEKAK